MDKHNRNRTDLLVAGRKKLQQFRNNKKEGKGSKPSRKPSKSEHDADADSSSAVVEPTGVSEPIPDGERLLHELETGVINAPVTQCSHKSLAADIDVANVDLMSEPARPQAATVERNLAEAVKSLPEDSSTITEPSNSNIVEENYASTSVIHEGESTSAAGFGNIGVTTTGIQELVTSEGEPMQTWAPIPADLSGSHDSFNPDEPAVMSVQVEHAHGVDQVTDVGAMQEVEGSDLRQVNGSYMMEQEEDIGLSPYGLGESNACTPPENRGNDMETLERKQMSRQKDVSDSSLVSGAEKEIQEANDHSVLFQPLHDEQEGFLAVRSEMTVQQADAISGLSNEENTGLPSFYHTEGIQMHMQDMLVHAEKLPISTDDTCEDSLGSKVVSLSPWVEIGSITLSQLVDVIGGLGEEEIKFLLASREQVLTAKLSSVRSLNAMERLKEHLYLASFEKDIIQLQLGEQTDLQMKLDHQHLQLVNETSMASGSLHEVGPEKESLAERLAECKSELQIALFGREEVQKEFETAKIEIEGLSARVDDLQSKLERSHGELSNLSTEFVDCRSLVAALQIENENLNRSLNLLTDERKNLMNENEELFLENKKFAAELAESRAPLASLQLENGNLSGILASLSVERSKLAEEKEYFTHENDSLLTDLAEEKKKNEEEKEYFLQETDKLSTELQRCKDFVEVLQSEIADLQRNLTLVTDEKNKLEEEKKYFISDRRTQKREFEDCRCLIAGLQVECSKAKDDLKEAMSSLEQLMEDNIFLKINLELYMSKITEFDDQNVSLTSQPKEAENQVYSSEVKTLNRGSGTDINDSCFLHRTEDTDKLFPLPGELSSYCNERASPIQQFKLDAPDDPLWFLGTKRHLEDMDKSMQKLEEAIDGMHSHSASLNRSADKLAAPGVSKLIQAFESKARTNDNDSEEMSPSGSKSIDDSYILAKEESGHVRAVLKELVLNVEHSSNRLIGEERGNRVHVGMAFGKLKSHHEELEVCTSNLEEANIQLMVLYEAIRQHVSDVEVDRSELFIMCEHLRKQEVILKAENNKLGLKLGAFQAKISNLQFHLMELCQISDEMVFSIHSQVDTLHQEVFDNVSLLEEQWNSIGVRIIQAVGQLNTYVQTFSSTFPADGMHDDLDVGSSVAVSVDAAIKAIYDMQEKLEASEREREAICSSYNEINEKFDHLQGHNELNVTALHDIYSNLSSLVTQYCRSPDESETEKQTEKLLDPPHPWKYCILMEELEKFLDQGLQLESVNNKLNLELMDRSRDIDRLTMRCLSADVILKLINDAKSVVKLEDVCIDAEEPAPCLQFLVSLLVQKCKEADDLVSFSRKQSGAREMELSESQGQIEHLDLLIIHYENDIFVLKESLRRAEEKFTGIQSELQDKAIELEQSEQRVSSLREKLGIAVSKGKGLIVQRDSLKQSLAEMSSELNKCMQELQSKDAKLHDMETKLKTYSEAGERVDALESELSYIRTSATALRESFLLKDSLIQRIEEILETLELPEHFHSGDIIEKVDWLARAVTQNALTLGEWDQKGSVCGGSYSDSGFQVMDAWKEDLQASSSSVDDLQRKYEDLRSKFYRLAEQNEMLEQSLMERNNVVQRWEEILSRVNMPSQLWSLEPEDKIMWLGSALSEAHNHSNSLQQRIDKFENFCGLLSADLEESRERISELEASLQSVISDKEHLSKSLEIVAGDYDKVSEKARQSAADNAKLQNEVTTLQDKLADREELHTTLTNCETTLQTVISEKETLSKTLEILTIDYDKVSEKASIWGVENEKLQNEVSTMQDKLNVMGRTEEHTHLLEDDIRRLQHLVSEVLQDPSAEDISIGCGDTKYLERLLRKLIEKYTLALFSGEPLLKDAFDEHITEKECTVNNDNNMQESKATKELDIAVLKTELDGALVDLMHEKEERDRYMEINKSLVHEVEALQKRKQELHELLSQEEQRSASVREKLNVAVRKGKSLVQQRDEMKQTIEGLNSEMERLKSEITLREHTLLEYEQKIKVVLTYQERVESAESEILFLRGCLTETEHELQEKSHTLSMILSSLGSIDFGCKFNVSDPVETLDEIGKLCRVLRVDKAAFEHESKKSKRAADLLLAELNEVQERNDSLQEELAKVASEHSALAKGRDSAEAAKHEALSRLEQLSAIHSEERKNQYAEFMVLKSSIDQLRKAIFVFNKFQDDILTNNMEFLHNLKTFMMSCLELSNTPVNLVVVPIAGAKDATVSKNLENEENFSSTDPLSDTKLPEHFSADGFAEICSYFGRQLQDFASDIGSLGQKLYTLSFSSHEEAKRLYETVTTVHREMSSQKESLESMKTEINHLDSVGKEKDKEMLVVHTNFSLLYEACSNAVMELEKWKVQLAGNGPTVGSPTSIDKGDILCGRSSSSSEKRARFMADKLSLVVRDLVNMQTQIAEVGLTEMKTTVTNLQKELQDKDVQKERISMELVSQIKEAQAAAKSYLQDLEPAKDRLYNLERQVEVLEAERGVLEQKLEELPDKEAILIELQDRVRSLTDGLAGKEQEIEELMQALDEEEGQMENLTNKIWELERVLQQKNVDLEKLEASHRKSVKKLSVTVNKFDELHHLSASLLSEVERLQTQLQERDKEISFLRQEVTRCTNDALIASQTCNKRSSDEVHDFLAWLDMMISCVQMRDMHSVDKQEDQFNEYQERFQKQIVSIISELEGLRSVAESKESLLLAERTRVEELIHKTELLENSLHEKECQLSTLQGVAVSGIPRSSTSEILEVEPVANDWAKPGASIAPQVRSLRKANNDQVAIAVDMDAEYGGRLEDEDDDKAHGFRSLTTSKLVPRFTRPVTDMIDGLWVSCDRALMRQPALRLGVIIYWAILHTLLAIFVV